jgi:hypothetical protein
MEREGGKGRRRRKEGGRERERQRKNKPVSRPMERYFLSVLTDEVKYRKLFKMTSSSIRCIFERQNVQCERLKMYEDVYVRKGRELATE